jgi:hypothetical protein
MRGLWHTQLGTHLQREPGLTSISGERSENVTGTAAPTMTIKPSATALKALRAARKHGRGVSVKALLTFTPTSGGPVTIYRSIVVRLQ